VNGGRIHQTKVGWRDTTGGWAREGTHAPKELRFEKKKKIKNDNIALGIRGAKQERRTCTKVNTTAKTFGKKGN